MTKTMREESHKLKQKIKKMLIDGVILTTPLDGDLTKIANWHISQLQRERDRVIEEFAKIVDKSCDKDFGTYDYKQIAEDFISEINSLRKK